jgi:carboxylesterase type B
MRTVQAGCEQGTLIGEDCGTYVVYRGIPYAEAPVGDLRFAPPVRKKPWKGTLQALSFGSICPQASPHGGFYGNEFYDDPDYPVPEMSEDCLYLNIWTPKKPGRYPVAFYVHGGAFDHGFSSEKEFDGERFCANGVILVTVNYRVGVFGFYADEELRKNSEENTTGNYGLLDQIMALRWVYDNISAFSGDRHKITVFGQSAGALSAEALCASPLTRGLIHSAIFQSGVSYGSSFKAISLEQAEDTSTLLRQLLGVETEAEMRKVSAGMLVAVLPELYKRLGWLAFGPVIDDHVLTTSFDQAVQKGKIADIPYMLGMTDNDIFVRPGEKGRNSMFFKGMQYWAETRASYSYSPVYLYYFERHLPGDAAGAFHSCELWYTFGTMNRCWRPFEKKDLILSDKMITAWTDFIKSGSPGKDWMPYQAKTKFVRTFL